MRVLVHPTDLSLGGSSLNAVQLASALQHRGHDVLVAAPSGALSKHVAEQGLAGVPTRPAHGRRPQADAVMSLRAATRTFRPDVIHTWEFGAYLNGFYAASPLGVPQLATVMSMDMPTNLPRSVPVTLGTRALAEMVRGQHRAPVLLLEPPVDVESEHAAPAQIADLRWRLCLHEGIEVIVIVSRLAREMKLEGILDTIAAVQRLSTDRRVALVIVGSGDARATVEAQARRVNHEVGRPVVHVLGSVVDPRPHYAIADVVVGMGSSVLRAMAFGKPCVVVGVQGFVLPVNPTTFEHFDREGMWGEGTTEDRPLALERHLRALLVDLPSRRRTAQWGRDLVHRRFSLAASAETLERHLTSVVSLSRRPGLDTFEGARTLLKTGPAVLRSPWTLPRAALRCLGASAAPSGSE